MDGGVRFQENGSSGSIISAGMAIARLRVLHLVGNESPLCQMASCRKIAGLVRSTRTSGAVRTVPSRSDGRQ